jgi:hypothetical protein
LSYMTLHTIPSEFPYIRGKPSLLFYQCGFLQILFPRSPNLDLYLNKITVLCVLAWFYFFVFRERFKRFYSPSPTETFLAKGFHCFAKEKIIGHIFFKNCSFTFFSFFCFLQSLLAAKTLVLVGQNEHIYFCIFAERQINRENTGNVAKRAKKCKITKMLYFAKIFLPRKFVQKNFSRALLHFLTTENHFLFCSCYLNQVYSTTVYNKTN